MFLPFAFADANNAWFVEEEEEEEEEEEDEGIPGTRPVLVAASTIMLPYEFDVAITLPSGAVIAKFTEDVVADDDEDEEDDAKDAMEEIESIEGMKDVVAVDRMPEQDNRTCNPGIIESAMEAFGTTILSIFPDVIDSCAGLTPFTRHPSTVSIVHEPSNTASIRLLGGTLLAATGNTTFSAPSESYAAIGASMTVATTELIVVTGSSKSKMEGLRVEEGPVAGTVSIKTLPSTSTALMGIFASANEEEVEEEEEEDEEEAYPGGGCTPVQRISTSGESNTGTM